MSTDDRRAVWRDLAERRLPEAARSRPDWPVRLDHCFARILLDHACGGPWRDHVTPPAYANMPADRLEAAIALGEAVLAGEADLDALNRRSLAWRGKLRPASAPRSLTERPLAPNPPPHPEVPERSGGLEGDLQGSRCSLEPSFEAASPHLRMGGGEGTEALSGQPLRMRASVGQPPIVRPDTPDEDQGGATGSSGLPT